MSRDVKLHIFSTGDVLLKDFKNAAAAFTLPQRQLYYHSGFYIAAVAFAFTSAAFHCCCGIFTAAASDPSRPP